MLIGIVGTIAAGKGTVTKHFADRGFTTCSLSDILRKEATRRGQEHTRKNLQDLGNELRATHGAGVLMQLALREYDGVPFVIESIRNPEEARLLKENGGFIIGVDANPQLRFKRELTRAAETGRVPSAKTYEEFLIAEGRERSDSPTGLQLHTVLAMADVVLHNNGTWEELVAQLASLQLDDLPLARKP